MFTLIVGPSYYYIGFICFISLILQLYVLNFKKFDTCNILNIILYFGIFGNYCYTVFVRQNLRCDISGLLCVMSMMCVFMISSPSKEMFNTYLSVSPQDLSRVSILVRSRVEFQEGAEFNSRREQSSIREGSRVKFYREHNSIQVGTRVQLQ